MPNICYYKRGFLKRSTPSSWFTFVYRAAPPLISTDCKRSSCRRSRDICQTSWYPGRHWSQCCCAWRIRLLPPELLKLPPSLQTWRNLAPSRISINSIHVTVFSGHATARTLVLREGLFFGLLDPLYISIYYEISKRKYHIQDLFTRLKER